MKLSDFVDTTSTKIEIITLRETSRATRESIAKKLSSGTNVILTLDDVNTPSRDSLIAFLEGLTFERGQLTKITPSSLLLTPRETSVVIDESEDDNDDND